MVAAGAETPRVDPRPIELGDGPRGVLLLHGLTGTPYEVRPMAEALHARGFAVRAPLLAGHEHLGALERTNWRDWARSAEQALIELRAGGARPVMALGFSLGGLLALRMAALMADDVASIVAISVPLELPPWQRSTVRVLARLRTLRGIGGLLGVYPKQRPDVRIEREIQASPSLPGFPYPTLAELTALQSEVADVLPKVRAPLLLLHGRYDHAAPVEHSERIAQRVGSSEVRRVVLPHSFHIVGHDLDRERVCSEVVDFAIATLGDPLTTSSMTGRNP